MSEYIEIESELSDDETAVYLFTNLALTDQNLEEYQSRSEMEEGSPLAQALAVVEGINSLSIEGQELTITRAPDWEWHMIINDVTAIIKDFFL